MITKEEIKKEVDKLPEGLLEEVYAILKRITERKQLTRKLTPRDFRGQFDKSFKRKIAYE